MNIKNNVTGEIKQIEDKLMTYPPLTDDQKQQAYKDMVVELVGEKYSQYDTLSMPSDDMSEYNAFVENCKAVANNAIYGEKVGV